MIEKTRAFEQLRATKRGDLETFTIVEFFVDGHGPHQAAMVSKDFTADAMNALIEAKAKEIRALGLSPSGS